MSNKIKYRNKRLEVLNKTATALHHVGALENVVQSGSSLPSGGKNYFLQNKNSFFVFNALQKTFTLRPMKTQ
jgi:hypothetical protein